MSLGFLVLRIKLLNIIKSTSPKEKVKACLFKSFLFGGRHGFRVTVCLRHCISDLLSVAQGAGSYEAFLGS